MSRCVASAGSTLCWPQSLTHAWTGSAGPFPDAAKDVSDKVSARSVLQLVQDVN